MTRNQPRCYPPEPVKHIGSPSGPLDSVRPSFRTSTLFQRLPVTFHCHALHARHAFLAKVPSSFLVSYQTESDIISCISLMQLRTHNELAVYPKQYVMNQ